jgi:hypothetical protein
MIRNLCCGVFVVWVFTAQGQIAICDGCLYSPSPRKSAFNDSLNVSTANDGPFTSSLQTSLQNSKLCFIAHIQNIRQCSNAAEYAETLSIVCDTQIVGPKIKTTFDVLNKYQRLWKLDCLASAQSLVGQKFLCFLTTDTIPREFHDLGVWVSQCSAEQGIFVTKSRIVTFKATCSSHTGTCWDWPVFANLKYFLETTRTVQPAAGKAVMVKLSRGGSLSGAYDINGRLIGKNTRLGMWLIIKDNKILVNMGR